MAKRRVCNREANQTKEINIGVLLVRDTECLRIFSLWLYELNIIKRGWLIKLKKIVKTIWGGAQSPGRCSSRGMGAQQGKETRCGSGSSVSSNRGKPAKHYQRSKASSKESRSSLAAGNVFTEHNG